MTWVAARFILRRILTSLTVIDLEGRIEFTLAFDLNFLNLFDQETVTGIYTTMNPSSAPVNAAALGFSASQPSR